MQHTFGARRTVMKLIGVNDDCISRYTDARCTSIMKRLHASYSDSECISVMAVRGKPNAVESRINAVNAPFCRSMYNSLRFAQTFKTQNFSTPNISFVTTTTGSFLHVRYEVYNCFAR